MIIEETLQNPTQDRPAEEQPRKEDTNPSNSKNTNKPKRNPFEKVVDDSITICDKLLEDKDCSDLHVNKFITSIEKEVKKKEEFYLMVKLFEKVKLLKEKKLADFQDTEIKNNFIDYRKDLINIKATYENKKKPLSKEVGGKPVSENEQNNQEKEKECEELSKKKKKDNKKERKMIDTKDISKKLQNDFEKEGLNEMQVQVNQNANEEGKEIPQRPQSPSEGIKTERSESGKKGSHVAITNSDKKKNNEKNNSTITSFFLPKPKLGSEVTSTFTSGSKPQLKPVSSMLHVSPFKTPTNDVIVNINEYLSTINNDNKGACLTTNTLPQLNNAHSNPVVHAPLCPLIYHHSNTMVTIDYNVKTLPHDEKDYKIKFYKIKGIDINNIEEYRHKLRKYMSCVSKATKSELRVNHRKKRKLLFVHDSFISFKKCPEKKSFNIKPRNPFKKDEFLIDYDKDSEEEYLEENAEDIKSHDNSEDEEDNEEEEIQDGEQWIVPDGHFSEDEVSEKEIMEDRMIFDKFKGKISIMDILDVRKNFNKPIMIDFQVNTEHKYKFIQDKLKVKIFVQYAAESNTGNNIAIATNSVPALPAFPIKFESKKTDERNKGVKNNIKERMNEIVNEVHGSFFTKDFLIKSLKENYPDLSKKGLSEFFKGYCLQVKITTENGKRLKKWAVKHELLQELDISSAEISKILEKNEHDFEEKEKERLRELEINRQKMDDSRPIYPSNEPSYFNLSAIDLSGINNNNFMPEIGYNNNLNINIPNTVSITPQIKEKKPRTSKKKLSVLPKDEASKVDKEKEKEKEKKISSKKQGKKLFTNSNANILSKSSSQEVQEAKNISISTLNNKTIPDIFNLSSINLQAMLQQSSNKKAGDTLFSGSKI